jgi:hypothetical protein
MHEVFATGQLTTHLVVFSKGTVMGLFSMLIVHMLLLIIGYYEGSTLNGTTFICDDRTKMRYK